jgi:FKBP-type peptidyl-prolyl cis-trans isomerase
VTVHYRGTLIDGREFDSSHKRDAPATFQLNRVIKGWAEGLQLMREGGKAKFVIPPKIGYGDRGPLAHRVLIFEVDLLSVDPAPAGTPEGVPGD